MAGATQRGIAPPALRPTAGAGSSAGPLLLFPLLVLLLLASACAATPGAPDAAATPKPTVIVTTPVLGDVVRNALGDEARVEVLVPPGVDPRAYVVSAEQRRHLPDASVVVVNGLGEAPELGDALLGVRARGHAVIDAASRLNPLPTHTAPALSVGTGTSPPSIPTTTTAPAAGSPLGTVAPSGTAPLDLHVWLDADRMTQLARIVADAVGPLPSVDRTAVQRRTDDYAAQLARADEAVQAALLPLPEDRRALVTEGDRLGYFAERYGLQIVASLPEGALLAPADLDARAERMRGAHAQVILSATDPPSPAVRALAAATGARVVSLDVSTLGPPGSATDTEVKLLTALGDQLGRALAA